MICAVCGRPMTPVALRHLLCDREGQRQVDEVAYFCRCGNCTGATPQAAPPAAHCPRCNGLMIWQYGRGYCNVCAYTEGEGDGAD